MNKLPIKQIYLLLIIVFGIVTLSVYSTYSIFTLESSSQDIVSIHTPKDLNVLNNTYEYQQVAVSGNSYITTDLDIYNNMEDELCYSVWYKVVSENIDIDKIIIYQDTDESILTNGVISGITNRRIKIIITNDNDEYAKVNIGLLYSANTGTCELNIPSDKLQIVSTINNPKNLANTLIDNVKKEDIEEGYLTYKYTDKEIELESDNNIYISNQFTLKDEVFELQKMEIPDIGNDYKEIKVEELINYQNYYTCFDDTKCDLLYRINSVSKNDDKYVITDYDILVPYMASVNGLRKVDNDYYFYGDNPNNFVYYNCLNELDNKTCELWRIIGFINKDGKYLTKLIRNDSVGKYKYDNQIWNNSNIYKYLNKDYKINNINLIKENIVKQENITDLDINLNIIKYLDNDIKDKVLVMNLSDYLNGSVCENKKISEYTDECISKNWLNNKLILNEYTLSVRYQEKQVDEEDNEILPLIDNEVYSVGNSIKNINVSNELDIRPVVYLSPRTLIIAGDGTFDNPYVLR